MQLSVTGHHVEITAALRSYVEKKLDRIVRHFDHVIDTHFVLTVEKLLHRAEAAVLWMPLSQSTVEPIVYEIELADIVSPAAASNPCRHGGEQARPTQSR